MITPTLHLHGRAEPLQSPPARCGGSLMGDGRCRGVLVPGSRKINRLQDCSLLRCDKRALGRERWRRKKSIKCVSYSVAYSTSNPEDVCELQLSWVLEATWSTFLPPSVNVSLPRLESEQSLCLLPNWLTAPSTDTQQLLQSILIAYHFHPRQEPIALLHGSRWRCCSWSWSTG